MNERIKELAKQAEFSENELHIQGDNFQRFAELIVLECEQVSLQSSHRDDDMGAIIARNIKKHFGLGMSTEDKKTLIKELLGVKE